MKKHRSYLHAPLWAAFTLILAMHWGCAHHMAVPSDSPAALYHATPAGDPLVSRYAPLFLTHNHDARYNRIGRPSAKVGLWGVEKVYVDSDQPVVYYQKQPFTTATGRYTNLLYRIHFSAIPFSLVPFNLSAGKNVGVMVVITLDENRQPLLVTTVQTCGCYAAILPTNHLPQSAYPEGWQAEPLLVYGEKLPAMLDFGNGEERRLLVTLRPEVHRVMGIELVNRKDIEHHSSATSVTGSLMPIEALEQLPFGDATTSFYHRVGVLKGHVKGSVKLWESLFLSWISLDLFVGTDKIYGDRQETGNPFYTSLKPWNRKSSDMGDFERFLSFWGWRL